jgi:hypothetical protein
MSEEESSKKVTGFSHLPNNPELDKAIDLANVYIKSSKLYLGELLEQSKDFDEAVENAPHIRIEVLKGNEIAYTPLPTAKDDDKRPEFISISSTCAEMLKYFCDNERDKIQLKNEDPGFTALSFFMTSTILHEFCHFLVRFRHGKRKSPMKLRKQHRGERADIGHSTEIRIFGGIIKLIQIAGEAPQYKLALDITSPARRVWVDMDTISSAFMELKAVTVLYDESSPDFNKPFELQPGDKIFNASSYDDNIQEEDLVDQIIDTDESILLELGLDPKTAKIFPSAPLRPQCLKPHPYEDTEKH